MDWEYQGQGPVDVSSPFAQFSRNVPMGKFATTPSSHFDPASRADQHRAASFQSSPTKLSNPFADAALRNESAFQKQQQQQQQPRPPSSSSFHPQIRRPLTGASFRNPPFTTPQRPVDENIFSECSGAEESPALTDTSEMPFDTPELDQTDDFGRETVTPATANRKLFTKPGSTVRNRTPGRGQVPRGNRDKVRKRRRQAGDRDVGSVRSRLPHDSADSDSDFEEADPKKARPRDGGFISRMFTTIRDHPSVPLILSWWVQLGINVFIVSLCMWAIWGFISMMRADIAHATNAARSKLLGEMETCAHEYTKNRCAPKASRMPALGMLCDEWEACMNQDPASVMRVQISAKNVAEIINEFVGVMSLKAWGFILSTLLIAILANNIGFGRYRETAYTHQNKAANPFPSQAAGVPMLPASQAPDQAYIWAPIGQTPRHIKRNLFADEATDTDASPDAVLSIMPPPQTPSRRRSPSKGDRGRSPTKYDRSLSKGH